MKETNTIKTYTLTGKELIKLLGLGEELFISQLGIVTTPDNIQTITLTVTDEKPKNKEGSVGYNAR